MNKLIRNTDNNRKAVEQYLQNQIRTFNCVKVITKIVEMQERNTGKPAKNSPGMLEVPREMAYNEK